MNEILRRSRYGYIKSALLSHEVFFSIITTTLSLPIYKLQVFNFTSFQTSTTTINQSSCLTPVARISLPRPRRNSLLTPPSPPSRRSRRLSPTPPTVSLVALSPTTASPPPRRLSTRPSAAMTTLLTAVPPTPLVTRSKTPLA